MISETVLSLSGVYRDRDPGDCGKEEEGPVCLDLTGLGGTTFFCEEKAAERLRQAIRERPLSGLHWIDSGDYHYLTLFWLEKIREPFTLLLIDHHSDMQESVFGAGLLSCGNWVLAALGTLPMLKQAVLVGPPRDEDAADDRLLWIPEEELPSAAGLLAGWLERLPVYLSLDKDVLDPRFCVTGWSQGTMTPDAVTEIVNLTYRSTRVLGIDICGEAPPENGGFDTEAAAKNKEINRYFRERIRELEKGGAGK